MTYWTLETVYSEGVSVVSGDLDIGIDVRAEVPMDDGDQRLPRRGHRYFRTFIEVEVLPDKLTLWPDEARELAQKLLAAADAAEAIDAPDTDTCGHWWPCDCEKAREP